MRKQKVETSDTILYHIPRMIKNELLLKSYSTNPTKPYQEMSQNVLQNVMQSKNEIEQSLRDYHYLKEKIENHCYDPIINGKETEVWRIFDMSWLPTPDLAICIHVHPINSIPDDDSSWFWVKLKHKVQVVLDEATEAKYKLQEVHGYCPAPYCSCKLCVCRCLTESEIDETVQYSPFPQLKRVLYPGIFFSRLFFRSPITTIRLSFN